MAGSFRHVTDPSGTFSVEDRLDDLGDAREAIQEMYWMIHWLTAGNRKTMHKAWLEGYFKRFCPPENIELPMVKDWRVYWQE